jgi:competence protein ComEC
MKVQNLLLVLLPCALILGLRLHERWFCSDLRILFFDVGQGDAALVTLPGGSTLLVDSGGGTRHWNMGKAVLFKELTRKGILRLDAILMTHPDADHARGFLGLAEGHIETRELWYSSAFQNDKRLSDLFLRTQSRGRPFSKITGWNWKGVEFKALPPQVSTPKTNNRSLALGLAYGGCRILFTADIEEDGEKAIAPFLHSPVHVLKVGHHGSKTSTTTHFLNRTRPQLAVISSGKKNRYGHPHSSVLKRLSLFGTDIFRTDFHGFVEITVTKDGRLFCDSFEGKCGKLKCSASEKLALF